MTTPVSNNSGAAGASSGSGGLPSVADQTNRFLTLLVTQLQNQDPLNPMDNAAITSQMAQLSTVTGIQQLNDTLTNMSASQAYQTAGLIGHTAVAPGSIIGLAADTNAKSGFSGVGGFSLPTAADNVTVTVEDATTGTAVKTITMGSQDAGVGLFAWDGTTDAGGVAAAGTYKFVVSASAGGNTVAGTSLTAGNVNSVLLNGATPTLNISGLGNVPVSSVLEVL
ncbi:MAG TPA: flagellar hook assembly protein FlgD [Methylophilaceae bacterium]|jgi:flagellar basal-body rod modification protein FlgD